MSIASSPIEKTYNGAPCASSFGFVTGLVAGPTTCGMTARPLGAPSKGVTTEARDTRNSAFTSSIARATAIVKQQGGNGRQSWGNGS